MAANPGFCSLIPLPTVITVPGEYRARCGDLVAITRVSTRPDFGCLGMYLDDGIVDSWHCSGRLYFGRESMFDIVSRVI